jgi:hypothetical protein
LGLAAVGGALAFSVGFRDDSPVAIAGALLVLFAVLTGLAAGVTVFALDIAAMFRLFHGQVSDGNRRNDLVRERASELQSSGQPPTKVTAFSIVVVVVILFFNAAIVVFVLSPQSGNPIAVMIVALTGFAVAFSLLLSARVRAWLRQLLTTGR